MLSQGPVGQWNKQNIEQHLKSAINTLTPDVLDKINLNTPQDMVLISPRFPFGRSVIKAWSAAAAACLCVVVIGSGTYTYQQNKKIDSVIGIDVNPSIELSINRKNKVLDANALNGDARTIIDDMELEGVDLNIAVNAIIGSMVTHGYLDDLDNAILVTVSNDSIKKAANLRETVVDDIEQSLDENQVKAVVYDQQAVENQEVSRLADQYGISYGKAYFLQELIDQNASLTMADMGELAPLTMEEIAKEISDRAYALGEHSDKKSELSTSSETTTEPVATVADSSISPETAVPVPEASSSAVPESTVLPETKPTQAPLETTAEEVVSGKVKIDYADYDSGIVEVNFASKVKWKDPTVSVKDQSGETYSAMITDMDSVSCSIKVPGLDGGRKYSFTIGGIYQSSGGKSTTVTGTFETPVISDGATEAPSEEDQEITTQAPLESSGGILVHPESTSAPSETSTAQSSAEA